MDALQKSQECNPKYCECLYREIELENIIPRFLENAVSFLNKSRSRLHIQASES